MSYKKEVIIIDSNGITHFDERTCRLQKRDDVKVISTSYYEPEYITPVREGNKAFPVFERLKDSEKVDNLLDTSISNDCESMEEVPVQKVKKI